VSISTDRPDLPVLLLYNLDPAWTPAELDEARQEAAKLDAGLRNVGHPVTTLAIDQPDLITPLAPYAPEDYIIFNWCEGVPGRPWSDALVAQTLETLHYAYTGAPPDVLAKCQDKAVVKHQLDRHHFTTPQWRLYAAPTCDGWNRFPAIVKPSRVH
jgi:D-alanine-D-alanine ligase